MSNGLAMIASVVSLALGVNASAALAADAAKGEVRRSGARRLRRWVRMGGGL